MQPFDRVVPWTTNQEFQQVFDWLYADIEQKPELVQLGVDRVKAWISRGRVPISVHATMDLVELQLREQKQSQGGNPLSQNELRLLYGIALIRFVNLMGDSLQSGYFAKSLYVIAQEIGLPQYFVQLRHAATHEELPSLVVLRQASIQALRWLDNNYWSAQIREDALTTVNEESLKTMSELITEYKEKRKAYLKKQTTDGNLSYMKYIKKLIPMLSSDILQESIIDLLLKNGGLVPTAKKKRPSPQDNSLSKGLIMLWQPLLQELDKEFPNFATGIISAILDRIDDGANFMVDYSLCDPTTPIVSTEEQEKYRSKSYLRTLMCWLLYFVAQCFEDSNKLFEQNILDDLLQGCLLKHNRYTQLVLQSIAAADPELGESIQPFILYIDRILSSPSSSTTTEPSYSSNPSSENMEIDMEGEVQAATRDYSNLMDQVKQWWGTTSQFMEQMTEIVPTTSNDALPLTGWVLHDEESWSSCPIGCLPNGKLPKLDIAENEFI